MAADPRTPDRVANCGWYARSGVVEIRDRAGSVYPAQLIVCGRPWAEPVCSAKIRTRKGAELSNMITAHTVAAGGGVSMITLTAGGHTSADSLASSLGLLRLGWRKLSSSRRWVALRSSAAIIGCTLAYEFTHGADGWHPHLHVLVWHREPLDAAQLVAAELYVRQTWAAVIAGAGRYLNPRHGLDFAWNANAAALGGYVAKVQEAADWGLPQEMTRGDAKRARREGSRVPFAILADHYATGDLADWQLWREYLAETQLGGVGSIPLLRSTPGLRAIVLGPGASAALSDEQLAAVEVGGQLVGLLPWPSWAAVRQRREVPALLAAAEAGGLAAMNGWLACRGLGLADAPPVRPARQAVA